MKCLGCSCKMMNTLVTTRNDKLSYDTCPECGGIWLDRGELDKLAFQVEGSIEFSSRVEARADEEAQRECPRCPGVELDKVYFIGYSDIVLDRCSNCGGFWLDSGEMDKINDQLEELMPITGKGFSEFLGKGVVPYWHQRIDRDSSKDDFQVDVPPVKGAEKKETTRYGCPVCADKQLDLYNLWGVDFEACPGCRGIFLDSGELKKIRDKSFKKSWIPLDWIEEELDEIENLTTVATPEARKCPKCEDTQMLTVNYGKSNVLVDWCPSCKGVWLDFQEFEDIKEYLSELSYNLTADNMKEEIEEEFKELFSQKPSMDDLVQAKAVITAFISVSLFEHPKLYNILKNAMTTARSAGILS